MKILIKKDNGTPAEIAEYANFDPDYCNDAAQTYTSSNMVKLSHYITIPIEIMCLAILIFFQWMRNQYRDHDDSSQLSWDLQRIFSALSLFDLFFVLIVHPTVYPYPWVAAFIRPFYLMISIRVLREYTVSYFHVIKDSTPMVIFIVVFILYFSWMGQRLFSGTLEGVQYFNTFGDSFFNMLVLMTTSNYPDVMLPAYMRNRLACIYFITYLVIGLFLLMNLLLAIFYSNFKMRFERKLESSEDKRSEFLFSEF